MCVTHLNTYSHSPTTPNGDRVTTRRTSRLADLRPVRSGILTRDLWCGRQMLYRYTQAPSTSYSFTKVVSSSIWLLIPVVFHCKIHTHTHTRTHIDSQEWIYLGSFKISTSLKPVNIKLENNQPYPIPYIFL